MRVGCGVAVSGKVLAARDEADGANRPKSRERGGGGAFRRRAVGAIADDGIGRIARDVEHGCEGEVDAERGELARHGRRDRAYRPEAGSGDGRGGRKMREGRRQTVHASAFVIDGDERREARIEGVQRAHERAHGFRIGGVGAEERDARERHFGMEPTSLVVERRAREPREEESRDGSAERRHAGGSTSVVVALQLARASPASRARVRPRRGCGCGRAFATRSSRCVRCARRSAAAAPQ